MNSWYSPLTTPCHLQSKTTVAAVWRSANGDKACEETGQRGGGDAGQSTHGYVITANARGIKKHATSTHFGDPVQEPILVPEYVCRAKDGGRRERCHDALLPLVLQYQHGKAYRLQISKLRAGSCILIGKENKGASWISCGHVTLLL